MPFGESRRRGNSPTNLPVRAERERARRPRASAPSRTLHACGARTSASVALRMCGLAGLVGSRDRARARKSARPCGHGRRVIFSLLYRPSAFGAKARVIFSLLYRPSAEEGLSGARSCARLPPAGRDGGQELDTSEGGTSPTWGNASCCFGASRRLSASGRPTVQKRKKHTSLGCFSCTPVQKRKNHTAAHPRARSAHSKKPKVSIIVSGTSPCAQRAQRSREPCGFDAPCGEVSTSKPARRASRVPAVRAPRARPHGRPGSAVLWSSPEQARVCWAL